MKLAIQNLRNVIVKLAIGQEHLQGRSSILTDIWHGAAASFARLSLYALKVAALCSSNLSYHQKQNPLSLLLVALADR